MDISLRLKLFRVSAGLKQHDVAQAMGVTANFVSMLERGKREATVKYLQGFAKLVGVPLAVVLWEPEEADGETKQLHAKLAGLMAEYANAVGVR